ncbi:MAG: hypothetical protein ACOCXH_01680 [Cyclobacteriaceae bacterium]
MNLVRKFLHRVVQYQLMISIGGGVYYLTGYMLLLGQFVFPWQRFLIIVAGTWITYASHRGIINLRSKTLITSIIYLLYAVFSLSIISFYEVLFLLHLAIISFLYEPSCFVKINFFSLRKVPLIKLILLSYIWANISSIYPAINLEINLFDRTVSNLFWIQFCFILAITIPFDIRDFYLDVKENLITMPRVFGFKTTKRIALIFLGIYTIAIVNWIGNINEIIFLSLLAGVLIWRSDRRNSDLYFGLWLDGLLILYFLFILFHFHYDSISTG